MVYVWSLQPQPSSSFTPVQPLTSQSFSPPQPPASLSSSAPEISDTETMRQPLSLVRSSRLIEDINDKNVEQNIIVHYEKKKDDIVVEEKLQVPASTSIIERVSKSNIADDLINDTVPKFSTTSLPEADVEIVSVPASSKSRLPFSIQQDQSTIMTPFKNVSLHKTISQTSKTEPRRQYKRPRPVYIHKVQKNIKENSTSTTTSSPFTTVASFEEIFPNILNPTTPIMQFKNKTPTFRPPPRMLQLQAKTPIMLEEKMKTTSRPALRITRLQSRTEKLVAESKGNVITVGYLFLLSFICVKVNY